MTFRLAQAEDATAIAALHTQSWQKAYRGVFSDQYLDREAPTERLAAWQERLAYPPRAMWVLLAEEGPELVGFVCLTPYEEPEHGVMLDNLHVKSGQQGKGVGKTLLLAARARSRELLPTKPMFLYVLQANTPAIAFYDALGGRRESNCPDWEAPGGNRVAVFRYLFD